MNDSDNYSPNLVAIEEWKLLSATIARLEDVEYKMRSWLLALITGLAVALYSENIDLPVVGFMIIGILLVIVFAWMDLIHRMPKRKAIERSKEVEESLRKGGPAYSGPLMCVKLTARRTGKREELKRMFWNTPYVQILILVILLGLVHLLAS